MAAQTYARDQDGIVVELWPHDPAAVLPEDISTPVQAFGQPFGSLFVPCGADVRQGWTYDGKAFAAPVAPPEPLPPPREVVGYILVSVLTDDQVTALTTAKTKDRLLLLARVDPWPEDNPKVGRVAAKIGITPAVWFDLALAPAT